MDLSGIRNCPRRRAIETATETTQFSRSTGRSHPESPRRSRGRPALPDSPDGESLACSAELWRLDHWGRFELRPLTLAERERDPSVFASLKEVKHPRSAGNNRRGADRSQRTSRMLTCPTKAQLTIGDMEAILHPTNYAEVTDLATFFPINFPNFIGIEGPQEVICRFCKACVGVLDPLHCSGWHAGGWGDL